MKQTEPETSMPSNLMQTLAHHDAQIVSLGGQLKTLQGEVHTGFVSINTMLSAMSSKLDRQEAQPRINFHQAVSTVLSLVVLFSMVVGGIIWVTNQQFAAPIANVAGKLDKHDAMLDKLSERLGWQAQVQPSRGDKAK